MTNPENNRELTDRESRLGPLFASDRFIQAMDRNKDGEIQESEVPERLRKRVFDYADRNGDRVIDKDEIKQAQSSLRGGQ